MLADLAGGDWPQKARDAALGLTHIAQQESPIAALLLDLFVMFVRERCENQKEGEREPTKSETKMFSRDMVAILNCYTDRPWFVLRKGKAVTDMWLSAQLRPYGVKPKTVWLGGVSARGYVESDFDDVFRRYLPKSIIQDFLDNARAAEKPEGVVAEPDC